MIRDDIGMTVSYLCLHLPARNLQLAKFCQDLGSGFVEQIPWTTCIISDGLPLFPRDSIIGLCRTLHGIGKSMQMELGFTYHVST